MMSTSARTLSRRCSAHSRGRCVLSQTRAFSVLNRPPPNYEGHVPLNTVEKCALAAGSAIASFINPHRADMIAALSEATATPYFVPRLRDAMLAHPTGRRILRARPRITSQTLPLPYLRGLPAGSVGRAYAAWLDREGVGPDTRDAVRHVDDAECAYVLQRYRESHDFYHAVTGLPVFVEGELALKALEWANMGLPVAALSLAAVARLKPDERSRFWRVHLPWALRNGWKAEHLICVYWEEVLEKDVEELRAELGLEKPPDLRDTRKAERRRRRKEAAQAQAREQPDQPANAPM